MDREYLISELAEMFDITKRTLQYYDKIGLLEPAYIKENGYRVYGGEELAKLMEILFWKNIGLESMDIKRIFEEKTIDNIDCVLDEIDEKLNEQINHLLFLKENARLMKLSLNRELDEETGVKIQRLESRKIVRVKDSGERLENVAKMIAKGTSLLKVCIREKVPFMEIGMLFIPAEDGKEDYKTYSNYFYTVSEHCLIEGEGLLEEGEYACTGFEGDIKELNVAIQALLEWIYERDYKVKGDIIYSESLSSLRYGEYERTKGEIQVRVEKYAMIDEPNGDQI